ncbi:conserved hypothetical protein [Ricinus communis]|uniref:Uncharacterized protein n=1 Tax=Ricinus communis TaxID=3988 RepID=B9TKV8_RICCO|nr:conserved hypothetical protein [Ricinus communis]
MPTRDASVYSCHHPESGDALNSAFATFSIFSGSKAKIDDGVLPSSSACGEYSQNARLHPAPSPSAGSIRRSRDTSGMRRPSSSNWKSG